MFGYRKQVEASADLQPKVEIVRAYAAQRLHDAGSGDPAFPASRLQHHKIVIQQAIVDLIRSSGGQPDAVEGLVRLLLSTISYFPDLETNDPGVVAAIERHGAASDEYRAAMARADAMREELARLRSELDALELGSVADYVLGETQRRARARRPAPPVG